MMSPLSRTETGTTRVLVVGTGVLARATVTDLVARQDVHLLGSLALDHEQPHPALGTAVLGSASDLADHITSAQVDEVYLSADVAQHHGALQRAVACCERMGVPFAVPAHVFRLQRSRPRDMTLAHDGYLHYECGMVRPQQARLKRAFDAITAGIALLLLLPLFAVVAAAIRLDGRGPIFFRQERVGRFGRGFRMLKFRSMVVAADAMQAELLATNEQTGPVFKMARDPRVTRVGRFIRRYSIDELPQLWNVLVGEMSIVGPRPPLPKEVAQYDAWQRRRLSLRPGLTCYWQTQGRNRIGFDQWMYLDMQYVDQWSLGRDLRLILRTIPAVVMGDGAS